MLAAFLLAVAAASAPVHLTDDQLRATLDDQLDVFYYHKGEQNYAGYDELPHDVACRMEVEASDISANLHRAVKYHHFFSIPMSAATPHYDISIDPTQLELVDAKADAWDSEALRRKNECGV